MSSYMSKFHKSLVCKFTKISIDPINNSRPSTKTSADAQEGTKANHDRSDEKRRRKRSRKCTISKLTGCGCQSKRGIVLDRIPDDSQMPEACSVQSIPSCTSSLESEWISSSATFDEMLKVLSSSSNSNHKEVHHIQESSIEKNSLEMLHISNLKFNDLVNKLRKSEQISTTTLHSHKPLGFSNELVECKVEEKRLISNNREEDRMKDSLLIMKSSCDPRREFKESMMEMIVENKIKDGKDMEELLACFLYLNSEDYHDVIIQVFKQLWAELIQV